MLILPVWADDSGVTLDGIELSDIENIALNDDPDEYKGEIDLSNAEIVDIIMDSGVPSEDELAELLEQYWNEYHSALEDNAQAMHDKEQSLANRTLGAAAIGATGAGMMEMMASQAEQDADAAAEADMKAYIATFACDYGAGRNIKGGQTSIEVPGGNDLISMVTEYRTLAADLKTRKEALGKQPGIESEVIYDIAETGLYDNVGMGHQSGASTSLYRALTDENSKDATEWAEQKEDAAKRNDTGKKTVGAVTVGAAAANIMINGNNTEKSDQIKAEYEKKVESLGVDNE